MWQQANHRDTSWIDSLLPAIVTQADDSCLQMQLQLQIDLACKMIHTIL